MIGYFKEDAPEFVIYSDVATELEDEILSETLQRLKEAAEKRDFRGMHKDLDPWIFPHHYDEHGNVTLEFEWMIIATYFMLGLTLMKASVDTNLDRAKYLVDFCIYGAFGAHGVAMLFEALNDYEREWGHLMPWGDVPLLFTLSAAMYYLKTKYEATLKV